MTPSSTLSHYQRRIAEIVPEGMDPRHVEAYMRGDHNTLDHLTPERFDALARDCAIDVAADPEFAERVAQSYGL